MTPAPHEPAGTGGVVRDPPSQSEQFSAAARASARLGRADRGPLARRLYDDLTSMQYAQKPDRFGWLTKVG